ncbi:amino acid adenylation domain-containing protein [Streptomyces sp. ME18-1-4]|uniref:amino acid adenylation domain-containing protein n=1 Tax=Streptomyces sp. ME18-1-4 TaxID=3028685 RepID=UPI0029A4D343|nr:amino acid adenylation domain-containing protein [Streptomyces sp. ME18-1-4]MDX3240525.1 amino acid adenylation domain-containing protein [Streptomyces sp. ME18-1-4]
MTSDFRLHGPRSPLTAPQNPAAPPNVVVVGFVERGGVDTEILAGAVMDVVAHHAPEIVRAEHDGAPEQFDAWARHTARRFGQPPFDPSAAASMRFLLLSHEGALRAVAVAAPRFLLDAHAVGRLFRALFSRHDQLRLDAPAARGHAGAQSRPDDELERLTASWADRLAEVPTVLKIPSDRPRPHRYDTSGARLPVELSAEATQAVLERSRALGVTSSAFLLGAFGLLLGRMTGADSLLVGIASPAGELLPVRIDIDDDRTPGAFVRAVHESVAWSLAADGVPFPRIVERLGAERSGPGHPLVQTSFSTYGEPGPERIETGTARIRIEETDGGGSRFDLSLRFGREEPSYAGHAEYATSLWSRGEAQRFVLDYVAAVQQLTDAAGDDDGTLADVRCISPAGRAILAGLNETGSVFPSSSLDELFRAVAARRPAAVAVRDAQSALTYSELAAAAAEQARLLRAAGVQDGDTVLIGVQRSAAEAVAVLGTLWAGGTYVGVDLTQPAAHTAGIVAKAAPAAAIVGDDDAGGVARHGVPVVSPWRPEWTVGAEHVPPAAPDPDRPAYIAFTSGTTGEPKGVAVPHRAVIPLFQDTDHLVFGPGERVLRLSSLAFDVSAFELWGALLSGGVLEVCPPGLLSPGELGAFIEEREVTVAWLAAGHFRLVQEFAPTSLGTLRQLLTGGDVVPHEHVARALADHPGLTVTNGYGPTENAIFTTFHSVRRPQDVDGPLPIGTPVPGTRVYVLDRRARLLPPGAVGELCTGGEGLAVGYVDDEEETDRRFGRFSPDVPERIYRTGDLVRIDQDGRIHFVGRVDHQVKVRGYRVELTAISDALNGCPEVEETVVTVTDGISDKRLLAAVRLAPGTAVTPVDLRDRLAERFPSFMVPSLWAVVDRMPLTANGKVDRRALAASAVPANVFARGKRARRGR